MDYNSAEPLTNGVFIYGIKLFAGSLWAIFIAWLVYDLYFGK